MSTGEMMKVHTKARVMDSDDLRLYYQTVGGEKDRFKLRVRTYSDRPNAPTFFEVRRR